MEDKIKTKYKDRTKYIPAILSLMAGFIASIITILCNYDALNMMIIILVALVVFYIAGSIVRVVCERNFVIKEQEDAAEGEEAPNPEDEKNGEAVPEGEQAEEGSLDEKKE